MHPPINIIPRFKFFKSWNTFDSCTSLITDHWATPVQGNPMQVLHFKLKSLKPKLQVWNKTEVGNFHNNVSIAQQHLMEAQLDLDNLGYSAERSEHELICLTNYSQA